MESNIQSSFIPHDAGTPIASRRHSSGGIADLALMLAILAFAVSAALAVAVFFYQQYLNATATSDVKQLQAAEQQFQPALVDQLEQLDQKLQAASQILASHEAPSAFFTILDQLTAKTISYSSLTLTVTDPNTIMLEMDGVGQSINSIAFESDLMGSSTVLTNPIFSNLDHQADGVHFHLTANVDPDAVNFEKLTGGNSAAPTAPTAAPTTPVSPFGTGTQTQQ